jgi:hypothetical protein
MNAARLLPELDRHQAAILSHFDEVGQLVAGPPDLACPALSRRRWELVRMLRAYQLFKHHELFDPAIRNGNPAEAAAASRMKARCTGMGDTVSAYVRHWSCADVAGAWAEYSRATGALVHRLRAHLARERLEATELLARRVA